MNRVEKIAWVAAFILLFAYIGLLVVAAGAPSGGPTVEAVAR